MTDGADAPHRRRRHGRRQGPRRDRRRRHRRPPPSSASPSCSSAGPTRLGDPGGLEVIAGLRGHRHGRRPGARACGAMKDSSLVRAAEAVRDGKASAMVSAGNTGATMASACCAWAASRACPARPSPRRSPCPARDARRSCSTPAPTPSAAPSGSCSSPRWAPSSPAPATASTRPGSALLSIGEEPTKGNPLVKETHTLLAEPALARRRPARTFVGNVEGRDLMTDDVDVVVTDGFTGNVALKTLEGGMQALVGAIFGAFGTADETQARRRRAAARRCCRSTPTSSTPRTPAGPCSSASTGSASSATARRRPGHRQRRAGRGRDGRRRPGRRPHCGHPPA